MTGYRTITLTLPEEIVAAAEADVARGFAASLEAWFLDGRPDGFDRVGAQEIARRLEAIDEGRIEMLSIEQFEARVSAQIAEKRAS